MSQVALNDGAPVGSGKAWPIRTWAGTLSVAGDCATHYLHLMAFPCEKCKGPVIAGWIGRREDELAKETEITGTGTVCLLCGLRPDALIDPVAARHFRPIEWQWVAQKEADAAAANADAQRPAVVLQDKPQNQSVPHNEGSLSHEQRP